MNDWDFDRENTKIKREKRADDDPLVELKGGRQK
jgi:hypothetical protein